MTKETGKRTARNTQKIMDHHSLNCNCGEGNDWRIAHCNGCPMDTRVATNRTLEILVTKLIDIAGIGRWYAPGSALDTAVRTLHNAINHIKSGVAAMTFSPIAGEPTHCTHCDLAKTSHEPTGLCTDAEARYVADRPCNCYYWTLTIHQCESRNGQPVTQHWTPGTARQRVGGTFGS